MSLAPALGSRVGSGAASRVHHGGRHCVVSVGRQVYPREVDDLQGKGSEEAERKEGGTHFRLILPGVLGLSLGA